MAGCHRSFLNLREEVLEASREDQQQLQQNNNKRFIRTVKLP